MYNFIYTLNEIDSVRDSIVWSHMSGGGGLCTSDLIVDTNDDNS